MGFGKGILLWLIGIPLAFAAIVSLVQASGVLLEGIRAATPSGFAYLTLVT